LGKECNFINSVAEGAEIVEAVNYKGRMAIECSWENLEGQASDAINEMRRQLASI
jgi:ribosome biogenesis protein Tsr3